MLNLKSLREAKNISQQKLSSDIGVSRSTIAMWETGGSQPDNDNLKLLADYFNVSVDCLLGIDTIRDVNFYRIILSGKGIKIITEYLKNAINVYGIDKLATDLKLNFADIKNFINLDDAYGYKCWNVLDKILVALDTNIYSIFENHFNQLAAYETKKENVLYDSLNPLGKQKADEYIEDLKANPKYTQEQQETEKEKAELKRT